MVPLERRKHQTFTGIGDGHIVRYDRDIALSYSLPLKRRVLMRRSDFFAMWRKNPDCLCQNFMWIAVFPLLAESIN